MAQGREPGSESASGHSDYASTTDCASEPPQACFSIFKRFETRAREIPASIALSDELGSLSYRELLARAEGIAAALTDAGCSVGQPIAVLLPRGRELVASLLAIARCGAPYLALDIDAPAQRLASMLQQTQCRTIVGDRSALQPQALHQQALADARWIDPQHLSSLPASTALAPAHDTQADELFCVLYTSGSTGVPKGVELTARNVLNCLQWMQKQYSLTERDVMLHKTPIVFDVSMYELFWPLMCGARVALAKPEGHRDPAYLAALIQQQQVSAAHFVPSMLAAFAEDEDAAGCTTLRHLFAAGEALPAALAQRCLRLLPRLQLHNLYGPTEAGVVSHWSCGRDWAEDRIPIGHAVDNACLHLLDETLRPVAHGEEGELYLAGAQLARGYVGRPDLTSERFIEHPQFGRLYRSGDRARRRGDGALDYLGRRDAQVKLRGVRIELGEIEAALASHAGVVEAAAAVREFGVADERLLAWYTPREPAPAADELRRHLAALLPEAMLPQQFIALTDMPRLTTGKIDRRSLPLPTPQQTEAALPNDALQARLLRLWREIIGRSDIGVHDRFLEAGGNSLLALRVMSKLREALGRRIPLASFFAEPTVAGFAALLRRDHAEACASWLADLPRSDRRRAETRSATAAAPAQPRKNLDDPIAIVGMACRVPGAADVEAFWKLLAERREGIRDLGDEELLAAGIAPELLDDPAYVRRAAAIDDPLAFDAAFFGYTPRDAELTDPQQRVLLECAWHALEHAGIAPGGARIGVYAGVAHNQYFDRHVATHDDLRIGDEGFHALLGSDKDYAATRIAYKLDLRGPALTLQTACSSSGVALHLACQGLRAGDCEAAIVGGVRINLPQAGYRHMDGGPQSADGRVRPFDANANGMVLGSGVACLVLKPLSRALADGDRVYALVRGSAINNDGAAKAGYTAPAEDGQLRVIEDALAAAGVSADSVGYVEAHGTGTALGDPIEFAALSRGYAQAERIALGSVKGNIGHLDAGAGAIGLIKAALALHHRELPATLHFAAPNPECDFESAPFFVNTEHAPWPAQGARRAAVSSFGFGGTNFHGVLEEAPAQQASAPGRAAQLIKLSAASAEALRQQATRLADFLQQRDEVCLADVAYTLDAGRARLPFRAAFVASDIAQAIEQLRRIETRGEARKPSRLVFVFPGQGAQHVGMGRALYEREPLFREIIDHCAERLQPLLGRDLRALLYPQPEQAELAAEAMRGTEFAQPAIFAVSYATARLWQSWGLEPDALVGHSLGEFVAATLAGVFELDDALAIIAERGRLMHDMPTGGMLAVRLSAQDVEPHLSASVSLGGINAPEVVVLSGEREALAELEQRFNALDIGCQALHTSHAFHSPMMQPLVDRFAAVVAGYSRNQLQKPLVSTLSGGWASPEDLVEPHHWARQLREPVLFWPAMQTLLQTPDCVYLEIGPGQTLTTAIRQGSRGTVALASLPHSAQAEHDALDHLLETAARLFVAGCDLDARRYYAGEQRLKLGLPGYPFARTIHCLQPATMSPAATVTMPATAPMTREPSREAVEAEAASAVVEEDALLQRLLALLTRLTGLEFSPQQYDRSFLELGLDSLSLTQVASRIKAEFRVDLRFRRLLEDCGSVNLLKAWLAEQNVGTEPTSKVVPLHKPESNATPAQSTVITATFGAGARIERKAQHALSIEQKVSLVRLTDRYLTRTEASRQYAQRHRAQLADPRTVSGFRPLIKELVYPIVVERSEGAYLWDLDGNRYVDATCGFGSMFFGHRPAFVSEAIEKQLQIGWEIGPQTPLAGECARLFTECTGLERVAFCNTGSEAVIAAVRLARTVTGRNLIVSFTGDYHGIQDEVIVRAGANGRSIPAAPGIPLESVANTLILDYGSDEALRIIRERADDIAGVLIEPVQSRRPDFQPREFLQQLRELTRETGIAFIMDEVITGFRSGLRGAQAFYGVEADIGVYGKVFGGGMPIGAVAGCARFMDALDGGHWQYGDDSVPEAGVTYFAGTFVRHPLTLAAVRASLLALREHPQWPEEVAEKTRRMVDCINEDLRSAGAPLHLVRYASLWKPKYDSEQTHGDLLFFFLRERGIHIWEGRPCFLSTAHSETDVEQIVDAFRYAVAQMQRGGWFEQVATTAAEPAPTLLTDEPPLPHARIGRGADGSPAWFVPDPSRPGRYLQLELAA